MRTYPESLNVISFEECSSTNDFLRRHYHQLEPDFPVLIRARSQSAGRGRESRNWLSLDGKGIYCSFGFHFPKQGPVQLLSLASAVAVARMLEEETGGEFELKWPNDVYWQGKKIAGILIENLFLKGRVVSITGIGINVLHRAEEFHPEIRDRSASLAMIFGRDWDPDELTVALAHSFLSSIDQLARGEKDSLLAKARKLSEWNLDRSIRFHVRGHVQAGVFRGIGDDGGLILEGENGRKSVYYDGEILY